jgi:hypothetical protein
LEKGGREERRDIPWVARDPDFGEAEDVDAFMAGVFDDFYGHGDGSLEAERDWLCLNSTETDGLGHGSCFDGVFEK